MGGGGKQWWSFSSLRILAPTSSFSGTVLKMIDYKTQCMWFPNKIMAYSSKFGGVCLHISRSMFLKLQTEIDVLEMPVYTGTLAYIPSILVLLELQLTKCVDELSKWLCILLGTMSRSCEKSAPLHGPQGG